MKTRLGKIAIFIFCSMALSATMIAKAGAEVIDSYFGMNYVNATAAVLEIQLLEITYNGGSGQKTIAMPAFPGTSACSHKNFTGMPDHIGLAALPTYTTERPGDGETIRTIGQALPIDWDTSGVFPMIEITDIKVDVSTVGVWSAHFNTPYVVGLIPSAGGESDTEISSSLPAPQGDLYDALTGAPGNKPQTVIATGSPPGLESYIGQAFGEFIFAAARVGDELWTQQNSGTNVALTDVWGATQNNVFAVGSNGTILHYNGLGWTPQPSGTTKNLYGVWGSGPKDVFAVGINGTILHYNGSSWVSQPTGTTDLVGVWGSGPQNVFAVGRDGLGGTVIRYNGSAWSTLKYFPNVFVSAVWGADANNVFVVTNGGSKPIASGGIIYDIPVSTVYSTTDGGSSWVPFFDTWYDNLFSLWGRGAADIFTTGGNFTDGSQYGVIYHYDNAAWKSALPPTPQLASDALCDSWGTASNELFTVGYNGRILHNDGTGPASEVSGSAQALHGVWGICPADVFAVGDSGTILHRKRSLSSCTTVRFSFRKFGEISRSIEPLRGK